MTLEQFRIASELRNIKKWLRSKSFRAAAYADLRKELENYSAPAPAGHRLLFVSCRLQIVGYWKNHDAIARIFQDDPEGWSSLQCGFECYNWNLRVEYELLRRKLIKMGCDSKQTNYCFAYALATGQRDSAAWFGSRILQDIQVRRQPFSGVAKTRVGGFLARLYAVLSGESSEIIKAPKGKQGPYLHIWNAWNDPDLLRTAILKACEFHMDQAVIYDDDAEVPEPFEELADVPTNVVPIEIGALQTVRRALNLPTLLPQHPLLDTPLAKMPSVIPSWSDPIVEQTIQFLESEIRPFTTG